MNPSTAGKVFIVGFIAVDRSALFLLLVIGSQQVSAFMVCGLIGQPLGTISPSCAIVANAKTGGSTSKISTGVSR
jgi:hypothetical protein